MKFLESSIFALVAILILGSVLFIERGPGFSRNEIVVHQNPTTIPSLSPAEATSTVAVATSSTIVATSTPKKVVAVPKKIIPKTTGPAPETMPPSDSTMATRAQNPYSTPPESFTTINENVRGALVNILCAPHSGSLHPISGSGVIIDPRGVILTNAHVAQYILLSESNHIDLTCVVRTGSPASAKWRSIILYIPPVWINDHVNEITSQSPTGTGEHDYALLLITGSADGDPPSAPYPYIRIDTRQAIGFQDDQILVAGYPAEFFGTLEQYNLYAASSVTTIKKLLTFATSSIDVLSLGGVIEAQSGSSGGAVANQWGRLVGLVVTTSAGGTTADRDLRAITLDYISRDLIAQTRHSLDAILASDVIDLATDFTTSTVAGLIQKYIDVLAPQTKP